MNRTCFVIMPYGKKKDVDKKEIDFDKIYRDIIKPAVKRLKGFKCVRCDDIDAPGWIHKRMLTHIFEDDVAIVDISTLNANVFYELGVRHALRKGVTALIKREGTTSPFNIADLKTIPYTMSRADDAAKAIAKSISDGLAAAGQGDSLVYEALPRLRVERPEERITKFQVFEYKLKGRPGRRIGLVTGDREYVKVGDVWVNSENTEMQMDRYYGTSTSATIRYLGAKRRPTTGRVVEDTIADELAREMGREKSVDPARVIPTGAGELRAKNKVKRVFHVASVRGEPREGYRPIERIERCVTNVLQLMDSPRFRAEKLASVLFPILGTGPAGGNLEQHAERCIEAALNYMEATPNSSVKVVYFYVWTNPDLEICRRILARQPGLSPV